MGSIPSRSTQHRILRIGDKLKKIIALLATMVVTLGLILTPSLQPAQASPGSFAYVQYVDRGWSGRIIKIKCHTNGVWYSLRTGQHSRQFCGQNGWVDAIEADACSYLKVENITTGQIIQYGNGYHGYGPPGGYWNMWVNTRFPNPC